VGVEVGLPSRVNRGGIVDVELVHLVRKPLVGTEVREVGAGAGLVGHGGYASFVSVDNSGRVPRSSLRY